jgi:predicted metal-dependent peptidase
MVDTSASMTDKENTAAFSEVKGAIDQFDGKLKGRLGFFDAAIIEPQPFESVEDVLKIKPAGGGGTDFQIIFEYVHRHMQDNPPACIIILTDGYAPFPKEHLAQGIPVLWLIDNDNIDPPWGKVARISV